MASQLYLSMKTRVAVEAAKQPDEKSAVLAMKFQKKSTHAPSRICLNDLTDLCNNITGNKDIY